jgi:hypothetical protein
VRRFRRWWPKQPGRVRFAVILLALSVLGWPLSALTLARDEPQTVLGLSWLAISVTCLDVLFTSQVKADQDDTG